MKRNKYILNTLLVFVLLISCDDSFLERTPPSSLSISTYFETENDATSAINATYSSIQARGLYSEDYPKVAEVPSDDMDIDNTSGIEFNSFGFAPTASQIDNVFTLSYEGVARANLVLERVSDIEMDEALKERILAEAKFLRALYYWHLTATFGEVPLITIYPETAEQASVPKATIDELNAQMIQDLQEAANVLPLSYDDSNIGRATKGAANALLGKVYLYAERYPEAEAAFETVIQSGVYRLIDDYGMLIMESNENNAESIFEVQYTDIGGGAWAGTDGANANETNLRLRLNYPNGKGGFGNLLPTQDFVDEFEEGDPRLEATVFRQGDEYDPDTPGEEVFQSDWTPTGYAIKKGMLPFQRNIANSGINWPVIRYADVLLMYAEALNENGKLQEAIDAVNLIRARVDMPLLPTTEYPVSNQQEMFEAIVHERRVELGLEYHRYNDLRRWGLAEQELGALGYTAPRNEYMPLPAAEIDTNTELVQNPNY